VWEVKLINGSNRHELYIDVTTGKIIHHETKRVRRDDDHGGHDDHGGRDHHGGRDDHDDD
jgi:hypothetical protein